MIIKKLLIVAAGLAASGTVRPVMGQSAEGIITYEIKTNMHRNISPERQEMKNMIPEFATSMEQLFFNENESLYKPVEEEEEDDEIRDEGMRMRIHRPKNEVYVNKKDFKRVMLQEFMDKKYLIEDSLRMRPWILGGATTEIHGYVCRQATFYDEERKQHIVAWYADAFRPFLGPENFNTLPGAVLQVDINNGERIITAKNIEFRPLGKKEMKVPASKTKTTDAEFRRMVKEQTDRMRANGGNIIIRN